MQQALIYKRYSIIRISTPSLMDRDSIVQLDFASPSTTIFGQAVSASLLIRALKANRVTDPSPLSA